MKEYGVWPVVYWELNKFWGLTQGKSRCHTGFMERWRDASRDPDVDIRFLRGIDINWTEIFKGLSTKCKSLFARAIAIIGR